MMTILNQRTPLSGGADTATADTATADTATADIVSLVKRDLEGRVDSLQTVFGKRPTAWNGRDSLADAYQNTLDLAMCLRQIIEEASFYAEDDWK